MTLRILNRLSPEMYAALRDAIESECGIILRAEKHLFLERLVRERMQANGITHPDEYVSKILHGTQNKLELKSLIGDLVVGETSFFRDPNQFRALQEHVLPELAASGTRFPFPIWSAGCATGEEAYSIAISALERFPGRDAEPVRVLATDINRAYLQTASEGLYPSSVERSIPGSLFPKYFEKLSDGRVKVRDEVRRLVQFEERNLVESLPSSPYPPVRFSVIFCRNVTIYFRPETTRRVMERFFGALQDNGALFLGYAETLWGISEAFSLDHQRGTYYYRKKRAEPAGTNFPQRSPASRPSIAGSGAAAGKGQHPATDESPASMEFVLRASMLADSGSLWEAERQCREAMAADPACKEAAYLLAVILRCRGMFPEALFHAERALSLDSCFVLAVVEVAECLHHLGRDAEETGCWNRVLELLEGPFPPPPPRFVPGVGFSAKSLRGYAKARLIR